MKNYLIYLFLLSFISCNQNKGLSEKTTIRFFDEISSKNKYLLKDLTSSMVVDSLKKYPNDIWILYNIPEHFCDSIFIGELKKYSNDSSKCSKLSFGREGNIPKYNNTNIATEIYLLQERISFHCRPDSIINIDFEKAIKHQKR